MALGTKAAEAPSSVVGLARRSLVDRLRSTRQAVIVISGPAGAGKTALVESWARKERNVRFLRISHCHNTAGSLLDAILAAVGSAPGRITPEDVPLWTEQLTRAVAAAPFTSEHPCRLVLDGAEMITDPDAQLLLHNMVESCPPTLRLLVTTRHRSPMWISRSRARGVTATIKADELRLRRTEVVSLAGEDLPEFDGWALGVGLVAALGRAEAAEAIREYLRNEVMARVTTEVRNLLHAVAIAGDASPALAIHLTDNPAAGELLARFASTTQFATVTEGPVFALHPVLSRHLNDELTTEHWQSYVALRRRHAEWLVEQGRLDQSTRLFVELGTATTARSTLLARWQRSVLSGNIEVVQGALSQLPTDQVAGDARLCLVLSMVNLAAGDQRAWRRWADVAEAHEGAEIEPGMPVAVAVDVSRRFAQAVATGTMPDGAVDHPLQGLWSAIWEVANGLCSVWAEEYAAAAARFRRAEVAARVSGDNLALVHALAGHALAAAFDGDSHAVLLADEAIAAADRLSPQCRWVVANAYLALATAHFAAGTRQAAHDAATRVFTVLCGVPGHIEQRTYGYALELLEKMQAPALSAREQRVLRALCGPLTLREIADELYVSHNTIKSQVSSIFRKLGVHDRAAAVAAARSRTSVKR